MPDTEPPRARKGLVCPLHRRDMSRVCHRCPLWVKIIGKNPQAMENIEQWNCSLALLPVLLIENSQMERQTGAAVESLRNETLASNENAVRAMARGIADLGVALRDGNHRDTATAVQNLMTAHQALAIADRRGDR
jgi:hypothetical protein